MSPRPRDLVRASLLLVAVVALAFLASPMGRYLTRAAWEEARILRNRRSIVALVADTAVSAPLRQRLQLVLDARQFAVDSIGLVAKESFTTYSALARDTRPGPERVPAGHARRPHLVVSGRRALSLQGILRLCRGAARGRRDARSGVRHLPAPGERLLHPRLVQRPPALDDGAPASGSGREHRGARAAAQHCLCARAGGVQ
ncbi:MAG: aminopeptidase [Gemmatimonadetes bacterium]|nr:aminopeptidase [Gemmatimonadota bacterium]